jgi:hypothetical protein
MTLADFELITRILAEVVIILGGVGWGLGRFRV